MTGKDKTLGEVRLMTEHYAGKIYDNWELYYTDDNISLEEYLKEVLSTITDYFECAINGGE